MPTLWLIILHPLRAAEKLRQSPRWLGTFFVIAAGLVVLRLASQSHLVESTLAAFPATATAGDRAWARSVLDGELVLRVVFLPFRQIAGMGAFAFFLFLLCAAFDPPVRARFTQVLALEIHAEVFNLIGGCASLAMTLLGSGGNSDGIGTFALLTSPKIFTLWYVAVLTAGIMALFGFSKLKAGLVTATAWIISALFNLVLLESVSAAMHLRV